MKKKKGTASTGVKEIARLAKVSIATVDRVIHKREGVSEKTKKKIEAIIEKLNYQPNILAQRLALASRGTIRLAVLLPNISGETEFWQAPLEGIRQAEKEIRRYNVEVKYYFFDQNDPLAFVRQIRSLSKYKADGILFTPTFPEESLRFIENLDKERCPYVLINCDIPGYESLSYIGPDILHSGYLAGQLVNYGMKDGGKVLIVNISGEIDNNYAILRKEEGFREYFKDNGLKNELISFNTTQTDYSSVSRKLDALLKKEKGIRAFFVTNSRVSVLARYLEQARLNDSLLLGYDFVRENVNYLKRGVIDFLICEKPQEQGYRGIMTLFQHLVFSNRIEKKYLMPIDIITKENYQFYRN